MKKYFIPITEIGLVEFLSSGFIGISTSKVEYEDIHTRLWPNAVVVKTIEDSPLPICCEVELKGRAYSLPSKLGNEKVQLFKIKPALSINEIKRIHFPSKEELNEFVSKYHYMSDLNIESLPLSVNDSLLDKNTLISDGMRDQSALVENKKVTDVTANSKVKLISDGKSIIAFTYALHNHLKANSSRKIPVLSTSDDVDAALNDIASQLGVKLPPKGLNLLLREYWELCRSESIDARSDQMEIVELLQEKLHSNREDCIEVEKTVSFLEKISNVFMGMEPHPNLDEKNPEKAFQFGFYVSLMAKTSNEFAELKNRFRFSGQVEAIAKYFFALRNRFSQLTDEFFKSFGTQKSSWTSAILDCYFASKAIIKLSTRKGDEDLRVTYDLAINEKKIGVTTRDISPEEQLVVSTLRTFSIEPFRDEESGDIAVKKYVHSKPIVVTLKILPPMSNHHLNEVHVQYKTTVKHEVLSKSDTRLKILKLASDQGVGLGLNENEFLTLTRLQMIDTMDRDELWNHVEQVSRAGALMQQLVVNI